MLKSLLLIVLIFIQFRGSADSLYVKRITDTLSSVAFFGRGYVKDGMGRASQFIEAEMHQMGLSVKRQSFTYPVNKFPGKAALKINGNKKYPGSGFVAVPHSRPCRGEGPLEKIDSNTFINRDNKVLVNRADKLTWSVSNKQSDFSVIQVLRTGEPPVHYWCDIEASLEKEFKAANIIGTLKGSVNPDSVVVYTAHYDHLGGFGENTFYAGANDNAAGVALMLSIAKWYIAHPPDFTVVFIAFAGEEAGLVGSRYFTEHPLINLSHISFLLNLDLVGNGDEGITVVNATEYPSAFTLLQQINATGKFISNIYSRGKAANSDHYWFTEKGVPSFFIYTMGKRKAYHEVDDIPETLLLPEINDLEVLILRFMEQWMHQ